MYVCAHTFTYHTCYLYMYIYIHIHIYICTYIQTYTYILNTYLSNMAQCYLFFLRNAQSYIHHHHHITTMIQNNPLNPKYPLILSFILNPSSHPQPPAITDLFSIHKVLPFPDQADKWNHTASLLGLASMNQQNPSVILPATIVHSLSLLRIKILQGCTKRLYLHSPVEGCSNHFQFGAIMN